jgi:hypothetical protein
MVNYIDSKGKKIEKGFYETPFVRGLPGEGGQEGGEIIYFTGKFDKKNNPIVICSSDYDTKNKRNYSLKERPYNKDWFNDLKRVDTDKINKKVEDLELKLNWFKETLKKLSQ